MKKTIYRTVIRFEILSEEPIPDCLSLSDIDYNTDEGHWSGMFLSSEPFNEPLNGLDAVVATRNQGSDPEFFMMDDDGNNIEEE